MTQDRTQDFSWKIRVYYEDTDAGGVVFYANYLKFFERARTEWLRAMGVGQHALAADEGIIFIVKSTTVDYLAPAQLDDVLELTVGIEKIGRASVSFMQEAWRLNSAGTQEKLLARGAINVVCVKAEPSARDADAAADRTPGPSRQAANFRPTAIPQSILNSIRTSSTPPASRGPDGPDSRF
ncbi:MAG TPA: tol-pal system-associated acyl-CoA thioesterase [Herbaspirillum sp.]|jgi:acyl-CoA thioester hydrolase